jgi:putative toxin-antitoxin system antitoxin component (TIGR02293 family)
MSPDQGKSDGRPAERVSARVRTGAGTRATRADTGAAPLAFAGDTVDVIARMRSGTPARTIPRIASTLGISQDKLFELLDLPKSTVKGRISANGMLSPTEQDRVYRVEKVLARAVQVLEDEDAARTWLKRENRSLGGEIPLALLDTEPGYELVLDTLRQIEYGVVS